MPPLPNFLIIGAQKSATVWLGYNLAQHRDIYVAPSEAMFFNYSKRFHDLGANWYREQLVGWDGERIVGESTPGYLMPSHPGDKVAKRIRSTLPDARLIAILRNPVDRAQSAMVHNIRRRRLPLHSRLVDLVREQPEVVEQHNLINGGLYARCLEPFARIHGDRLLVLVLDDAMNEPATAYTTTLRHLGADDSFAPPDLGKVRHSNLPPGEAGPILESVRNGVDRAKRAVLRQSRRAGDFPVEPLSAADRIALFEYFVDDIKSLEGMLGRDLSIWEPDRSVVS